AEGDDLNLQELEDVASLNLRENLGLPMFAEALDAIKTASIRWANWQDRLDKVRDDAITLGHPLLIADTLAGRVTTFARVLMLRQIRAVAQGADRTPPLDLVKSLIDEGAHAIEVYRFAGSVEGEVRVKLVVADLHELI